MATTLNQEVQEYCNQVFNNSYLNPMKKKLIENGYNCYIMEQHALLDDEIWIHPDTIQAYNNNTFNNKYIFIFKDKFLNEWSSTQTQRRYKKLNKKQIKFLESIEVL